MDAGLARQGVHDHEPGRALAAGPLLQSARLDIEPPTVVQATQESISWLSRAITELDQSSEEAPASLSETLARLLAVWIFTDTALRHRQPT